MATEFFSILSCDELQTSILSLASTTADLIPYSSESGIEGQIPVLPGRIQVPVPALAVRCETIVGMSVHNGNIIVLGTLNN